MEGIGVGVYLLGLGLTVLLIGILLWAQIGLLKGKRERKAVAIGSLTVLAVIAGWLAFTAYGFIAAAAVVVDGFLLWSVLSHHAKRRNEDRDARSE